MSWACSRCRTVHDDGTGTCPNCEGGDVAKASAEGGATNYVGENDTVPTDLPAEVRLVGPGAPQDEAVAASVAVPDATDGVVSPEPDDTAGTVSAPPQELISTTSRPAEAPGPSTPPENSGESSDPADDDDGPADWAAYPIRVLRDVCREHGLSPSGAKADLVARLTEYDAEHQAA